MAIEVTSIEQHKYNIGNDFIIEDAQDENRFFILSQEEAEELLAKLKEKLC